MIIELSRIKERILLVDDEIGILVMLKEQMSLFGLEADVAKNGKEALNLLAKEKYGVLITDLMMPEMDGMELMIATRERYPDIDILVISGHGDKYDFSDLVAAGAADFIAKPFATDELKAKLTRIFRERRLITSLEKSKRTERYSKEEWENTFNAIGDIITIQDKEMRILHANKAANEAFKFERNQLVGEYCYKIFRGASQPCPECPELETFLDGKSHVADITHANLGKIFNVTSSPVLNENNEIVHIVHIAKDITDKKRLEAIAEAVNTMDNVGYVFSGIRHELGNPVNSIKMTLSVLKKNLAQFSPDTINQYVERTLDEIARVEYLLKSLRSFSLFERPEVEEVDISLFLRNLCTLMEADCSKKGIRVLLNLQADVELILADPRLLKQAMINVLVNSMDALEGRDDPCIQITVSKSSGLVWVKIEDNGCGIKDDLLKEIFKPLYTSKPHGTGLGMSLSKKMLASMNCTIEVVSIEDVGTSVIISIPEGGAPK